MWIRGLSCQECLSLEGNARRTWLGWVAGSSSSDEISSDRISVGYDCWASERYYEATKALHDVMGMSHEGWDRRFGPSLFASVAGIGEH